MVRGWYTGASGMRAQQWRLDAVANNLANVNTDSFKREVASFKSFPQMLLRRMDDDGVWLHPFGSADAAPVIGTLGTGVELNELYTVFSQGAPRETANNFDIMLEGRGFFAVSTPHGERYTRNGSFILGVEGLLVTKHGFPLLGENGPIRITESHNVRIDPEGRVWMNASDDSILVDTIKIVDFELDRFLEKQGNSLYRESFTSGPAMIISDDRRPKVLQGFLEASNVDPVLEMVKMIEINRAYEANQRVIQTEEEMLGTLINQVARFG